MQIKNQLYCLINMNNKLINYKKNMSIISFAEKKIKKKIKKFEFIRVGDGSTIPGTGSTDPDPLKMKRIRNTGSQQP